MLLVGSGEDKSRARRLLRRRRPAGYEFYAPLNAEGHLDRDEWRTCSNQCTVHRFWLGEGDEHGHLVHRGSGWAFHYEDVGADDDEPLFKLDRHTLIPGQYISIAEHNGVQRTFRVAYVG